MEAIPIGTSLKAYPVTVLTVTVALFYLTQDFRSYLILKCFDCRLFIESYHFCHDFLFEK